MLGSVCVEKKAGENKISHLMIDTKVMLSCLPLGTGSFIMWMQTHRGGNPEEGRITILLVNNSPGKTSYTGGSKEIPTPPQTRETHLVRFEHATDKVSENNISLCASSSKKVFSRLHSWRWKRLDHVRHPILNHSSVDLEIGEMRRLD